jgi:hypothetical protein
MDQCSISLFLDRQELSASVIHKWFIAVLGPDEIAYYLTRPIISNIFCNQFLNYLRNPFGVVSSFT